MPPRTDRSPPSAPPPTWGYNADGSVARLPTGGGLGGGVGGGLGGLGGGLGGLGGGIGGGLGGIGGGGFNGLPGSDFSQYGNTHGMQAGRSVNVNGTYYFNPTDHRLGACAAGPAIPAAARRPK